MSVSPSATFKSHYQRFLALTLVTSLALIQPATTRFSERAFAQIESHAAAAPGPSPAPAQHLHALPTHAQLEATKIHAQLVDDSTGRFNANYALDAKTTNTLDWSCIRNAESHDNYRQPSGAYGILLSSWHGLGLTGTPGQATISLQDSVALRIFAMNGHRFAGSWNDYCTMAEGLG